MESFRLSDERMSIPFSMGDIEFDGDTEREKELNKELFRIMLELNCYQDRYDNGKMKDVDQVKEQITRGSILSSTATTTPDYENGFVDALKWVVDNCLTDNEKFALLPKIPDDELERLMKSMRETIVKMQGVGKNMQDIVVIPEVK